MTTWRELASVTHSYFDIPNICYSEIVAYNIMFYGTKTWKHIIDNMNNTNHTTTYEKWCRTRLLWKSSSCQIKGKSLCLDIFLHVAIHSIQLNWKQYEASVMNLNSNVPFENKDTNRCTQGRNNCYPSRQTFTFYLTLVKL
jgi:hypothetical protein